MTVHKCPHCRCLDDPVSDMGAVNKAAPFYPLVVAIDLLAYGVGPHSREHRRNRVDPTNIGSPHWLPTGSPCDVGHMNEGAA